MFLRISILTILAASILTTGAQSPPDSRSADISSPPDNAVGGEIQDNIQLGLWTEKPNFSGNEIRNVWFFVRKKGESPFTIGVGGSLYRGAFLSISSNGQQVGKFAVDGGADGMTDASWFAGGLSERLSKLPAGSYKLVWKAGKLESNTIGITIK